ncbi:NAD(P)-dependent alcohol dehydrogenase [Alicyclobacillus mali (ex Roth et al. 2021)]|uniref:NAD(P)-dependent alcohol dehydrogenase n=1 Tax=Alicyclobacillus mali (ex Roth et al. 2021) TaxID=1123961 RepID=UPI003242DCF7
MAGSSALPKLMKAAYLVGSRQVEVREVPVPEPSPDEALIRVEAVGVCGSDVHYYEHGRIGRYVVDGPLILGHEASGVVVAVGANVKHLRPGQRVAIEPGVTCGRCDFCKSGRYNLCPHVRFLATPPVDGAFAQYIAHRADFVHPIPDDMSYEQAAMVEPFSVALHAIRRSGMRPGDRVAIAGMGPVGLFTVVAARRLGAGDVVVSDTVEKRLQLALRLGATEAVHAKRGTIADAVHERFPDGVDVAIETAGHPDAVASLLPALRRGGRLVVVGLSQSPLKELDLTQLTDGEIEIAGVFRYANTYPAGIQLMREIDVWDLITDTFPLAEAGDALERARTNKSESIKVVVYPQA